MKKVGSFIILVLTLTLLSSIPAYAKPSKDITVVVNNETIKCNPKPYLKDGEVMVPLRSIAEAIGGTVTWDKKAKTAWLEFDMIQIEVPIGKKSFSIHHNIDFPSMLQEVFWKKTARFVGNRVVVPANFFESLGMTVNYDAYQRILTITSDKSLLDNVPYEEVPYNNIKGNNTLTKWYYENNTKAGISYIRDGGYIYALIGVGEKNTGGYTINIDSVTYFSKDTVTIKARVIPPSENAIMVITYPSKLIRIKSNTIKTVVGDIAYLTNTLSNVSSVTMNDTTVSKYEFLSLDQGKLRDLTTTEKTNIMKSFQEATIDSNMYVQMITGNVLIVTMKDGTMVTFTSYGSKTNCVVSITKGSSSSTYHIVAPVIAELLLEKTNSLSNMSGVTMNETTVSKYEFLNLDQGKLRDLTTTEKTNILKSFQEATIDSNMYVQMITGNVLTVTMKDGTIVTFTSYGSKTNCVVTIAKASSSSTYHIVAPVIAELLLEKSSNLSKETGVTMDDTTVSKMELLNLDNVKIRDLTRTEKKVIMKSFREATIDLNMYVQMIAGDVLKVTMKDGNVLTFTSYGSKTNCVVTFTKNGSSRTLHIVAPDIAEMLLDN